MGHIRLSTTSAVPVHLKRSRRARRLSLRVSSVDGQVTLTVPPSVSQAAAEAFVAEKSDWIDRAVARCHTPTQISVGAKLPIAGYPCSVIAGQGRSARLANGQIEAPSGREGPAIEALLKHLARDRLSVAANRYAETLGVTFGKISLRDTRSRWGSCTSDGNLMFSWRLVLAPTEVLDYVAAHEVAHLRHMDHSPAFWACVEGLFPTYAIPRDWLRKEGAGLHRYRFRASD